MQRNVRKRAIYGVAIGVLMHVDEDIWRAPGDVGNATTFDFPVHYEIIPPQKPNGSRPLTIDEQAAPYIKAAKRLEYLGARALVGGCGFRAVLQRRIADAVNIPVFTSSLILVPLAYQSLARGKKVGIVTANSKALTDGHFQEVGWSRDSVPVAVQGVQGTEFVKVLRNEPPSPEKQPKLEALLIAIIEEFLSREPQIGAIVFECTNLPPFSAAVREAFNLPVFDVATLVNFAYQVVAGGRFEGYY